MIFEKLIDTLNAYKEQNNILKEEIANLGHLKNIIDEIDNLKNQNEELQKKINAYYAYLRNDTKINKNMKWTQGEEYDLHDEFYIKEMSISDIAHKHKRTERGIVCKLLRIRYGKNAKFYIDNCDNYSNEEILKILKISNTKDLIPDTYNPNGTLNSTISFRGKLELPPSFHPDHYY